MVANDFRAKEIGEGGQWVFGDLHTMCTKPHIHTELSHYPFSGKRAFIDLNTVGQYSGVKDKTETKIYNGDIIRYYEVKDICINPDCEPYNYIYEGVLVEKQSEVIFTDGMFCVEEEDGISPIPISWLGLNDLKELREELNATEENDFLDADGNTIDETKIGVKVVGNVFDNPNLI